MRNKKVHTGTGLQNIADLLNPIIDDALRLEDCGDFDLETMLSQPVIGVGKELEAERHMQWLQTLGKGTILQFPNGSKSEHGTVSSAWHSIEVTEQAMHTHVESGCQIGTWTDIEISERHAMREGLARPRDTKDREILLCVHNQNNLRALSRCPTAEKE